MARAKASEAEHSEQESLIETDAEKTAPSNGAEPVAEPLEGSQSIDDIFGSLKTLLGTVEKLQKARQEVGDIKPLVVRLLDGELLSGDDLEQLKAGIGGLSRLVRIHDDYQAALSKAQPARNLLDQILRS
ncbi:MAG TPA: hypothetical protein V6D29_20830 [Leptolyngbyaceae cyanobacterium]